MTSYFIDNQNTAKLAKAINNFLKDSKNNNFGFKSFSLLKPTCG